MDSGQRSDDAGSERRIAIRASASASSASASIFSSPPRQRTRQPRWAPPCSSTTRSRVRTSSLAKSRHERVRRTYLVVAIGTDEEEMANRRIAEEMRNQFEACRVRPLKIVQKQRDRVRFAREDAEEVAECPMKAGPRFRGRKFDDGRLRADDELELGDDFDDERAAHPERALQSLPPGGDAVLALRQDLRHEAPEHLNQGRIRNVSFVLVELAGEKKYPRSRTMGRCSS